jgi:cohesin loading factor subunit SCC2
MSNLGMSDHTDTARLERSVYVSHSFFLSMASTIIQTYFRPILDSYLTANMQLRISAVNCLSQILIQGLVYPIECVPYLIAMTTDTEKKIQVKALTHLTNLQKAHPGFIQSKSIAGMNMSYKLHKVIQCHTASVDMSAVVRGIDEGTSTNQEILSLNHHLYSLLRTTKQFRRVFVGQLLKMFNDTSNFHASLGHLLFICDNLAYFPYQMIDEPLYIIHRIDIIISVTGVNILQSFKEVRVAILSILGEF